MQAAILWPWGYEAMTRYPWEFLAFIAVMALLLSPITWIRAKSLGQRKDNAASRSKSGQRRQNKASRQ
ncbi:MAG: hypothetical protein KZY74_19925 [Paenibacillaceae bacterium]|uniref:Uncharacterized protein n=1 Tax=Paenibacillus mellifer TaxID=2937794 RepID=A0A9X2BSV9_9BACL|nr:hypothetical protein [Paenibacillus mellifer]MBW4841661.1 hypothetical protein [Paenibacillaceae bacterium]MCK8487221.1 hypothetical protein [Paenibacillus mellifer]